MVAWRLTKISSWRAATTEFIKFASKEAIPRATPFAFREGPLAMAGGLWTRHFSRDQSSDGMAVCRCTGIAGAEARSRISCAAADGARTRVVDWDHHRHCAHGPGRSEEHTSELQ